MPPLAPDTLAISLAATVAADALEARLDGMSREAPAYRAYAEGAVLATRRLVTEARRLMPLAETHGALVPMDAETLDGFVADMLADTPAAVIAVLETLPKGSPASAAISVLFGFYLAADRAMAMPDDLADFLDLMTDHGDEAEEVREAQNWAKATPAVAGVALDRAIAGIDAEVA